MASKCHHCGKIIKLKKKNTCPHCEKNPYHCRICGEIITNDKLCYSCGFFICEHCGACGGEEFNCAAILIAKEDEELLYSIRQAFELKKNPPQRECPRGVPISHAHGNIKDMELKLLGFNVKSEEDRKKFNERLDYLSNLPIGTKTTVSILRDDGSLGKETRVILNRLICSGLFKKQKKFIIKEIQRGKRKGETYKIPYDEFIRIDDEKPCEYLESEMGYKKCEDCGKKYLGTENFCIKETHKKPIRLKTYKKESEMCKLETKEFKKKKEE